MRHEPASSSISSKVGSAADTLLLPPQALIGSFGCAVGQDGDPRAPFLIKGTASSAILRHRLAERRSTVRPSSSQPPADITDRLIDEAGQSLD